MQSVIIIGNSHVGAIKEGWDQISAGAAPASRPKRSARSGGDPCEDALLEAFAR